MPFTIWLDAIPGLRTANSSSFSGINVPKSDHSWRSPGPPLPQVPQLLEVGGNDTVNRRYILLLDLTQFLLFPLQDAFQAFHINPTLVQKFLKPLLIGELAPGEPSQDRDKNVSIYCSAGVQGGYSHHFFPLGMHSREGEFSVAEHLHVALFSSCHRFKYVWKGSDTFGCTNLFFPTEPPTAHSRHLGWTEPILKGNGNGKCAPASGDSGPFCCSRTQVPKWDVSSWWPH